MNYYHGHHVNEAIKTRQMIMEKCEKIYRMAGELEKEAIAEFGWEHPVSENIGFACVHLMNGNYGLEENLYANLPDNNKLERSTLEQLFTVLNCLWWSGAKTRWELRSACPAAVKTAAREHGVEENTVRDIWVRRLGLENKTEDFHALVLAWLNGDASGLVQALKSHTRESLHALIDEFFREKKFCH